MDSAYSVPDLMGLDGCCSSRKDVLEKLPPHSARLFPARSWRLFNKWSAVACPTALAESADHSVFYRSVFYRPVFYCGLLIHDRSAQVGAFAPIDFSKNIFAHRIRGLNADLNADYHVTC
jgi:hypothetical protein